jgi:hypothetical protein
LHPSGLEGRGGSQRENVFEVGVAGDETDPGVKEIEAFGVHEWFARQAAGYSPVPAKQKTEKAVRF